MKINKDYFYMGSKISRVKYFLSQGNVLSHTVDRIKWHVFPRIYMTPRFPTHVDIGLHLSVHDVDE